MYKGLEHNKKRKKIKRLLRDKSKVILQYIYKLSILSISIYALEYHFELSLFVKLGILFLINEYFIKKI